VSVQHRPGERINQEAVGGEEIDSKNRFGDGRQQEGAEIILCAETQRLNNLPPRGDALPVSAGKSGPRRSIVRPVGQHAHGCTSIDQEGLVRFLVLQKNQAATEGVKPPRTAI
jgi:hypothetical protein